MDDAQTQNLGPVMHPLGMSTARFTLGARAGKNLGPTLSIFVLMFGPKLLISAGTLAPRVANWFPKLDGILFFQPWGQYKAIKFRIY